MSSLQLEPNRRMQYRFFGGFRLLLAFLVMVQHFGADLAPAPLAAMVAPYPLGSLAVLVFFALSGFVITEAIDCVYRGRPIAFLVNRMLRIIPHFLLAVSLSMLAHEVFRAAGGERLWRSQPSFPDTVFAPLNVMTNFFGVIPLADRFIDYNFLDIVWAVRVEMAFYLLLGACIAIGRLLPGRRGFAGPASGVLIALTPLFVLAVLGKGIGMLAFLPYFAFGAGLYFATQGAGAGWLTVVVSIPAIVWQCLMQLPAGPPPDGLPPAEPASLIILAVLLGCLTILAFSKIRRGQSSDKTLGNLTYPLYLYHEDVLVLILTFTMGYSYGVFAIGIVLSVVVAAALMALIDPLVTRSRNKVRGAAL